MKLAELQKYERYRASLTLMEFVLERRYHKEQPTLRELVSVAKQIKQGPSSFHYWGYGFPFFAEVEQAAFEIGQFCKRWGRINVTQTKEKYGEARVYCSLGIYQLHCLTHPGFVYSQYPAWLWHLDCRYISRLISIVRLNAIILPYQKFIYRLAYKRALKKYSFIREEILDGADWPELLEGL